MDRQTTPLIYLFQTPDLSTYLYLKYYSINRIQDAGSYTNNPDVVYRFIPGMCAGLAYYLALKRAPERVDMLKMAYEDEMRRALDEDGQRTSLYIAPQNYFPSL